MITALEIANVLICIFLILVVLLQGGENVDITAAFGGVSQAAFGPRGSVTLLAKATWVLAVLFIITTIGLWVHDTKQAGGSVLESTPAKTAPANPGPAKK